MEMGAFEINARSTQLVFLESSQCPSSPLLRSVRRCGVPGQRIAVVAMRVQQEVLF